MSYQAFSFVSKLDVMGNHYEETIHKRAGDINELIFKSTKNYISYLKHLFNIYLDTRSLNYIANHKEDSFLVTYIYLTNENNAIHVDKYEYDNLVNMLLSLQTLSEPLFDFGNVGYCKLFNNLFDMLQDKNRLNALFEIEKIDIQFSIQKMYSAEINAKSKLEEWTNKFEEFLQS